MSKKNTARRPSQSDQEWVTTNDGRKVRNLAYQPKESSGSKFIQDGLPVLPSRKKLPEYKPENATRLDITKVITKTRGDKFGGEALIAFASNAATERAPRLWRHSRTHYSFQDSKGTIVHGLITRAPEKGEKYSWTRNGGYKNPKGRTVLSGKELNQNPSKVWIYSKYKSSLESRFTPEEPRPGGDIPVVVGYSCESTPVALRTEKREESRKEKIDAAKRYQSKVNSDIAASQGVLKTEEIDSGLSAVTMTNNNFVVVDPRLRSTDDSDVVYSIESVPSSKAVWGDNYEREIPSEQVEELMNRKEHVGGKQTIALYSWNMRTGETSVTAFPPARLKEYRDLAGDRKPRVLVTVGSLRENGTFRPARVEHSVVREIAGIEVQCFSPRRNIGKELKNAIKKF